MYTEYNYMYMSMSSIFYITLLYKYENYTHICVIIFSIHTCIRV